MIEAVARLVGQATLAYIVYSKSNNQAKSFFCMTTVI